MAVRGIGAGVERGARRARGTRGTRQVGRRVAPAAVLLQEPPGADRLWEQALRRERASRRDALSLLRAVSCLNAASQWGQVLEAVRLGARELLGAQAAIFRPLCWDAVAPADAGERPEWELVRQLESWALRARRPIWFENLASVEELSAVDRPGAAVATPIFQGGEPCGVLTLRFDAPRLFLRGDTRRLISFIGQAAVALQRAAEP